MNRDLWTLARQGIWRRRRSSLLLFLVLLLSFAFAVMMLSVMGSMNRTNIEYLKNTYGAWYGAIPDGKDSDRAFLEQQPWLDRLGESRSYGTVSVGSPVSGAGTVDETFLELGRIKLNDGRLPEQPGEIAMEADLLSALGYDYTLDQTVTLPLEIGLADDPESAVLVEWDFTLTGILKEYAHLWILNENRQDRLLNAAIFLPEDGEAILAEAQAMADQFSLGSVSQPIPSYFYTPLAGMEELMETSLEAYGLGDGVCINVSVGGGFFGTDYNTFYVGLILVIALLAVTAVYLMELQSDVRRVVRLRSIGASRMQLRQLLLWETALLALPSLILGTALGAAGTVGMLRLLVFSGSIEIIVDIPWAAVAAALALWLLGVGLMRLLTFQLAVRTPMTGRMSMETRQRRRVHRLQRAFAWALSTALCLVATYSVLSYVPAANKYNYFTHMFSYNLSRANTDETPFFAAGETPPVITPEESDLFLQIPGITGQLGSTWLDTVLSGNTLETQSARMYVIDAAQWTAQKGAPFFENVDLEAYNRGEQAVLVVYTERDGTATTTEMIYGPEDPDGTRTVEGSIVQAWDVTAAAGDAITCTMEVSLYSEEPYVTESGMLVDWPHFDPDTREVPVVVGALEAFNFDDGEGQNFGFPFGSETLYSVLVAPAFVTRVLEQMPEGSTLGPYVAGMPDGFEMVQLFADLNAEFLSTDKAVAELARQHGISMGNFREQYVASIQGFLQTMLTIASSGICICLIAALLLRSTLELEAQRERRRYGILRALGMSRRQQNLALARQAALQAATAIAVSCGVYVIFGVRDAVLVYQRNEEAVPALLQLLVWQLENLRYTWFLPLLLLGEFLLVVALYFAAKGRLYKLNLMEMLSQER